MRVAHSAPEMDPFALKPSRNNARSFVLIELAEINLSSPTIKSKFEILKPQSSSFYLD